MEVETYLLLSSPMETEQQSTLQPESENPTTADTAAPPLLEPDLESDCHDTLPQSDIHTKVVQAGL